MNNKTLLALCLLAAVFTSCTRLYSPALFHNDIAYQPKPASFDKEKMATYVSAGLDAHASPGYNDVLLSGQLNLSQGFTTDKFNFSYGGFASFGDYQAGEYADTKAPDYFKNKFFGAVGGRVSMNTYVNNDRVDVRIIGIEAAYSHEFGSYADFRNSVKDLSGFYVDPRVNLITVGLTTEVIFHNRDNKDLQHGIRGFLGTTLGKNQLYDTHYQDDQSTVRMLRNIFPKASYYFKYYKYFGTIEVGSAVFLRVGYQF
ncbi:hypothetical protein [Mucilaginibacter antarcticus]|uniref:Outer membrane protein with beta-barrel domain n=1 Tax=Mucilaginibacter antarcticus TaxID=1855725 RepID=A0ABW5XQK4_9SPHI